MPHRRDAANNLGDFLGAIAHPRRVHIIEELWRGEQDVGSLCDALETSHPNVSQHLSVLRSHRIVLERREGRRVYYRLRRPELAQWLLDGAQFIPLVADEAEHVRRSLRKAERAWRPPRTLK